MSTFKAILITIIMLLSFSSSSFTKQETKLNSQIKSYNHEEYVWRNGVLYHIIYDEDGNVIFCQPVYE